MAKPEVNSPHYGGQLRMDQYIWDKINEPELHVRHSPYPKRIHPVSDYYWTR
jgi:hypothetical protein